MMPMADPHGARTQAMILATGRRTALGFLWMAAALLLLGLVFGLMVALYYTPLAPHLNAIGLRIHLLRPLHTGATIGWIYFSGMAMVYRWLFEHLGERQAAGETDIAGIVSGVARRAGWQRWLWGASVLAAAIAYASGYSTGREYMEYPPLLSLPILVGWLLFAVNFGVVTRFRLRTLPVYAWMWGTSVFLFVWPFVEAHAWLLDWLANRPVRDMAIQWKAVGSLVGSFNLLVYGSLAWLGTRLSGDERYARSNMAFGLLLVGVLNSFTNYGHHTYHLPQGEAMKWVSFIVSMAEALILVRVAWDCSGLGRKWVSRGRFPVVTALLIATTAWTCLQLVIALVISVPSLNAFVHGTLAIVAHSMGSLIGIDTMAMLAAGLWLTHELSGENPRMLRLGLVAVGLLNIGLFVMWLALLVVGVRAGVRMVTTGVLPWVGLFPGWLGPALLVAGVLMAAGIACLVWIGIRAHRNLANAT